MCARSDSVTFDNHDVCVTRPGIGVSQGAGPGAGRSHYVRRARVSEICPFRRARNSPSFLPLLHRQRSDGGRRAAVRVTSGYYSDYASLSAMPEPQGALFAGCARSIVSEVSSQSHPSRSSISRQSRVLPQSNCRFMVDWFILQLCFVPFFRHTYII
jgi:hypothetical protein